MTYRLSCPRSCQLRTAFPCFSTLIYQPHSPPLLPEIIISPMRVSLFRKYRLAKLKQGLGNLAPSLKDESKRRRRRRKKERKDRSVHPFVVSSPFLRILESRNFRPSCREEYTESGGFSLHSLLSPALPTVGSFRYLVTNRISVTSKVNDPARSAR